MTDYLVTSPSGRKFRVNGAASQDAAAHLAMQQHPDAWPADKAEDVPEDEPELNWGESAIDYAQSLGRGIKRGAVDLAGLPGTAAGLINRGIDWAEDKAASLADAKPPEHTTNYELGTPEDINKRLGITYGKSRTAAGPWIESVGEMIPSFAFPEAGAVDKLMKARKLGPAALKMLTEGTWRRAVGATGAGVGAEAAGELTDDNPWARAVGGGLGGLAAGARDLQGAFKERRNALAHKNLEAEADKDYDALRANTFRVPDMDMVQLADDINQEWRARGIDRHNAPQAAGRLQDMLPGKTSGGFGPGGATTIGNLINFHSAFAGGGKMEGQELLAGVIAREHIDDYLQNLSPQLGKQFEHARGNWSAKAKLDEIRLATGAGKERQWTTGRGLGNINAVRQEIRKIFGVRSKKRAGYSPEAIEQAERIMEGRLVDNVARFAEMFAPYDVHRALAAVFYTMLGSTVGHPLGGLALGGVGAGARTLADFLTREEVEQLMDIVAEQAPANARIRGPARQRVRRARMDLADKILRATQTGYAGGTQREGEEDRTQAELSLTTPAEAAEFKPIDPMNPSFTNPGGHEKTPPVENPARASRTEQVRAGLEAGKSFAQIARGMGTTRNAVAGLADRAGLKQLRATLFTPEGLENMRRAARENAVNSPNFIPVNRQPGAVNNPDAPGPYRPRITVTPKGEPLPPTRMLPQELRDQLIHEQRYGTGRPTPSLPKLNLPPLPDEESMLNPYDWLDNPEGDALA